MNVEKQIQKIVKLIDKLNWVDSEKVSGTEMAKAVMRVVTIGKIRRVSVKLLNSKDIEPRLIKTLEEGFLRTMLVFNENVNFLKTVELSPRNKARVTKACKVKVTVKLSISETKD